MDQGSVSVSSTPHPQINVELSRLCKTGACIKTSKRCIKQTFSYFSTFQRWPPPQLHMAGHNNRATKSCKKLFRYPWQLSLLAPKHIKKYTKICSKLFRAPSYLNLYFLQHFKIHRFAQPARTVPRARCCKSPPP